MIPRYKIQEIHDIWKTDNKLKTWLKVEMAHLKALTLSEENFTEEEFQTIEENISINKDRWLEIEQETRHDVQAFVQMLEESVPDNSGRWIHYGLTSSDILDTSLTLMVRQTLNTVRHYCSNTLFQVNKLIKSKSAEKPVLGRTHGKAAEEQTYYNIFTRWSSQLYRAQEELRRVTNQICAGKLSGAIGNNTYNSEVCETIALRHLDLKPVKSSQIIPRDIYLDYFYAILKVILAVEKIAYDIRIYSIDGVNEMAEPFRKGQKGSSAMPHKKNPILTENICGLTRLYKSYMHTAIENCNTLLERDISNSSSERIIFKDSGHIACFTLDRLSKVLQGLQILDENAQQNINKYKQQIDSQQKMSAAIKSGVSRKDAHDYEQLKTI